MGGLVENSMGVALQNLSSDLVMAQIGAQAGQDSTSAGNPKTTTQITHDPRPRTPLP